MSGNDGECSGEEQSLAPWGRGERPFSWAGLGWPDTLRDRHRAEEGQREAACLPWAGSTQGPPLCPLEAPLEAAVKVLRGPRGATPVQFRAPWRSLHPGGSAQRGVCRADESERSLSASQRAGKGGNVPVS